MKPQIILGWLVLMSGCSTAPKDVTEAWRQFGNVREGMSREEVHAVLKDVHVTLGGPESSGSELESWVVGQPFAHPGHSVSLEVHYDADDRVKDVERSRHRNPRGLKGAAYL